jgi:hypothetical protein
MEDILSEGQIKTNIQTQQTGEGEFVTKGTPYSDYSLFGPPKDVIKEVKKTFEKDIIPGSSSVVKREVVTDLSKVTNLPKIEDVMPIDNPEIQSEIASMVGYKDGTGQTIPFSEGLDVNTKLRVMNLGGATDFVYKREDGELDSIKIPYDIAISKMIKEPAGYVPPSEQAIALKTMGSPFSKAYDATDLELMKEKKGRGRFPSWMPFIGGDKIGVTLDSALGTNYDEVGGQIHLAKQYNKILIKAGLNERQRYGILKERLSNKFKDLYNIMGYGRRGIRYGVEAPVFLVAETYDYLTDRIKEEFDVDIAGATGTKNFKDSVSRTNFYDMIMPMQANIIQDGFAAQNINIDLGTAELLASMFTSTPARLAAVALEIGVPSSIARTITTRLGKSELKKYKAYREKKLLNLEGKEIPEDFDKKLLDDYADYRAKSLPFFNKVSAGDVPILGVVYGKINSVFTGPKLVHGLQIEEAGKALSDNSAVKSKLQVLENLKTQREKAVESFEGKVIDLSGNKRLELLDKQIEMANDDLRYEIATANVPQFVKDIAKQNKAMIIGSASMGQLAQESDNFSIPVLEMVGLFSGLTYAMGTNQRTLISRIRSLNQLIVGGKKTTQNFTEELAKRVNTFNPEFAAVLGERIKYIDDLQQDLRNSAVPEDVLQSSFATMSNLAILQTLEETARTDISQKNVAKFGSIIEDFQEISKLKKQLLSELKAATLRIADIRSSDQYKDSTLLDKFDRTLNIAYDYAEKRAANLNRDIELLQKADMAKIESIIKGTVGKFDDAPQDGEDISTILNRNYKYGYSQTEFPSAEKIKEHNKNIFDTVSKAVTDKAKSLRRKQLLNKAKKMVRKSDEMPEYRNSDDLFFAFGENKRNYENAEVSSHYLQLDKGKFIDADGQLVGEGAKVEGMDVLEKFLQIIPKNETEVFKQIGGGTIGTSKQAQIFRGFNQAADETINQIFDQLPPDSGFETAGDFVESILQNAPENMQGFNFMPKNLQAVYIIYKQGGANNVKIDSLPLNFDQLKELKSSFGRLQGKYFNPADNTVSNQFDQLKQVATAKFQEFQVNFGTKQSRPVGDLFILGENGERIPVARKLADGDAAHQVYMNRYFDNRTNYNYFFKNRNKTTPSNLDPTGITVDQKPSFTENVDKIFNMSDSELSTFKADFLKRFGTFKDETPMGSPQNVQRKGSYFINVDSEEGKSLKAILELKAAEYIEDAADKGNINKLEYTKKMLKLQKAYTGVDATGKEVSLLDISKIEKDLFSYSPASVGDELFKKGEDNLRSSLTKLSQQNLVPLKETYRDFKRVERNLRSVLPANIREGQTLIEVATANPTKFKQVKEGILTSFGGKYGKEELDKLISEVFMEDLTQKTFNSTGRSSVMGSGKELVTEVDMDVDRLKQIIGFNDTQRNAMVKEIIGDKRMNTLNSMVKWMSEQYDIEKMRSNITGIPRNFSVESYISRFYSINRGVISARYVGTEAVLQQFRLKGHKLLNAIITEPEVGQLFLEIVKTGQPLSRTKEIQFFNALVSSLNKVNTWADTENPEQTVVINDNYKAKYREYDLADQNIEVRQ